AGARHPANARDRSRLPPRAGRSTEWATTSAGDPRKVRRVDRGVRGVCGEAREPLIDRIEQRSDVQAGTRGGGCPDRLGKALARSGQVAGDPLRVAADAVDECGGELDQPLVEGTFGRIV